MFVLKARLVYIIFVSIHQYHKKVKIWDSVDIDLDSNEVDNDKLLSINDNEDPENDEIISTLDLPSFNNDLMKHTLPISESAPASKKSRNQVKRTKKQKPVPNIRQSYCLFPQNDLRAVSY